MDILIKLFDWFNATAHTLAKYVPQNRESVLVLWRQVWGWILGLNGWISGTLGVDIQAFINKFVIFFAKYSTAAFNFILELVKKLAERV